MVTSGFRLKFNVVVLISALAAALFASSVVALEVPPAPTDMPIVDQTATLTNSQKSILATKIAAERQKSGNQIAIVMIPSLEDEALEEYSLDIAREWGIGTGENNNGILLFVAKDDRRLRIEVGTGLEGALTDVQAGRIIRNEISPLFREGKYYEGIDAGIMSIIAAINGEYTAASSDTSATSSPWGYIVVFGFIVLSWLGSILGRTKSWWAGGVIGGVAGGVIGLLASSLAAGAVAVAILGVLGLIFDKIVSANYRSHASRGESPSWWAGGGYLGGGGGGSGGFGGFGGGGFGGGGASGDW